MNRPSSGSNIITEPELSYEAQTAEDVGFSPDVSDLDHIVRRVLKLNPE